MKDPTPSTTTASSIVILIAAIMLLALAINLVGDLLQFIGISRFWSLFVVVGGGWFAFKRWQGVRSKRKAKAHEEWMDSLASGFAQRLEEAREEAKRWRSKEP